MRTVLRVLLAVTYLAIVLVPLWLAMGAESSSRGVAYEVSLATGLVALSLLAIAYVLPKRVRGLSRSLGIDVVLGVHRLVGLSALAFTFAHIATVLATDSSNLALLDVTSAPGRARAAVVASVAMLLLVITSVWRRRLIGRYEIVAGRAHRAGGDGRRAGGPACLVAAASRAAATVPLVVHRAGRGRGRRVVAAVGVAPAQRVAAAVRR